MNARPELSPALTGALVGALSHAGAQLGAFVEREIAFHGSHVEYVRLEDLPECVAGGPERQVTAVYLAFSGGIEGHVVLGFTPEAASFLARTLLMQDIDLNSPALQYLGDSMVGELGNIACSAFLNAVANAVHLTALPTPPSVVHDMWGAILDTVVAEVAQEQSFGLLLSADFVVDGDPFAGYLVLLPSLASCARLEQLFSGN